MIYVNWKTSFQNSLACDRTVAKVLASYFLILDSPAGCHCQLSALDLVCGYKYYGGGVVRGDMS